MSGRNDNEPNVSQHDNEPGEPQRDARGRFAKGSSGNRRGRPTKQRWLAVPNQISRDVVKVATQMVTVPGPKGPRQVTRGELVVEAICISALKGKASSQKHFVELMKIGFADLSKRHLGVALAEIFRQLHEDPTADHPPGLIQAVDEWIKRIERL